MLHKSRGQRNETKHRTTREHDTTSLFLSPSISSALQSCSYPGYPCKQDLGHLGPIAAQSALPSQGGAASRSAPGGHRPTSTAGAILPIISWNFQRSMVEQRADWNRTWEIPGRAISTPTTARRPAFQTSDIFSPLMLSHRRGNTRRGVSPGIETVHSAIWGRLTNTGCV